ncbi:MAG: hypothetical protein WD176_10345, partial [Pirellulales bacterium]
MSRSHQLARACSLFLLASVHGAQGQVALSPLPVTQPLTINEPLDEVMVAGISRYAVRALDESQRLRDATWEQDKADPEIYRKSVERHRSHLRTIIGAEDEREPANGFEIVAKVGRDGVVARSADVVVYAIRWPVLPGITGEGLLLEPCKPPVARVIAIPDADWTPEVFAGLAAGLGDHQPAPSRLATAGVEVVVPTLISRDDTNSGSPLVAYTNQPHREFIYRQAFPLGRHIIGYEVEKVQAAVDQLWQLNERHNVRLPIGVTGVGEGGLLALHAAAIDPRVDAALVSGYFQTRTSVWQEPIYRNVWSLLTEFGDAEIANLIAPRPLVIEACAVPEVAGPPPAREGRRGGAAPGKIKTCALDDVHSEYERARKSYARLEAENRFSLVASADGAGPSSCAPALAP